MPICAESGAIVVTSLLEPAPSIIHGLGQGALAGSGEETAGAAHSLSVSTTAAAARSGAEKRGFRLMADLAIVGTRQRSGSGRPIIPKIETVEPLLPMPYRPNIRIYIDLLPSSN